jgi:BirA family biotin operon repressor/biotin-[acetyl-CoA-carboxylase] ligase
MRPDPVDAGRVAARLSPPLAGPVLWLPETGSTNDEAVRRAREDAPEGLVIGADHQTAGRGRQGRTWRSEPGDALLVSIVLRPAVAPEAAGPLAVVVALGLADALDALGHGPAEIVWPNDVLVGGRKVAGILVELSTERDRVRWAVAGIGVNVRAAPDVPDARWPPGSLADDGAPPAREDLLVATLRALGRRYSEWLARGPGAPVAAFAARDALRGRWVRVSLADGVLEGRATGLDELGRLRVAGPDGERAVSAGEVVRVGAS